MADSYGAGPAPGVTEEPDMNAQKSKKADPVEEFTPAYVKQTYVSALRNTIQERKEFWLNHSYLIGRQWLWWNADQRRLEDMPRDEDRTQAVYDRLLTNTNHVLAKALQQPLDFEVEPDGADDASLLAAHIGEANIEHLAIHQDWESFRAEQTRAMWEGGISGICVDWDSDAGEKLAEGVHQGEPAISITNVTEMVVEPGSRYAETARWWIKAYAMPPERVQAVYQLDHIPAADAIASSYPFNQRLLETELVPMTLVLTYYERPNFLCPEGRVAVVVNSEFVDGPQPWPFPFTDHLNLAVTRETPIMGKWTGQTRLSVARPVQGLLNAAMSSIIEHLKLAGNARLMVPASSIDMINELNDLPGQPMQYADGMEPPSYLAAPQMPGWEVQLPEQLENQIDTIMGVNDISRGETPPNSPDSGYGLALLSEQADTPIGRIIQESAGAWGKVATMCLELYEQNVTEKRKTVVKSNPGQSQTVKWTGKDLMGQTTVTVPLDAVLPKSRAAMQQFAQSLVQMGLVTSLSQFATIAQVPQYRDLVARTDPDLAKAQRENHALMEGETPMPAMFDNDETHINEHLAEAKSARFERSPKGYQQNLLNHIKIHENNAAHKMGSAVARGKTAPALGAVPRADGGPVLPPNNLPADPGNQTLIAPQTPQLPEGVEGPQEFPPNQMPAPQGAVPQPMPQPNGMNT